MCVCMFGVYGCFGSSRVVGADGGRREGVLIHQSLTLACTLF